MTLDCLLDAGLRDDPGKAALVVGPTMTTYADLSERVDRSAAGLLDVGVAHGDRVALFMTNRAELVELYLACFRIGAIAVPLNHRFQTDEVVFAVDHCEASLLVVDAHLAPVTADVPAASPSLRGVYLHGGEPPSAPRRWSAVRDAAVVPTAWPSVADDDPAMILYTSGSTGKPKGVTHTHRSILDTAIGRTVTQQLTASDVSLAATAICHAGAAIGVTFSTLYAGGTVVILEESDPQLFLAAVADHRPTRTLLLPAQLLDAVEATGADQVDLRCLVEIQCGGDQITPDLYDHVAAVTDVELNQAYGLTECEGVSMSPAFGTVRRGSIGRPRHGVEVRVAVDGEDVVDGATGELLVRSSSVMVGYWDDPEHTEATFLDGWLRTGDLVRRDPDGYLHFEGRIKEIIIKGGSNIAPGEVEDVLDAHPAVDRSGVVGSPDPRLGAVVHAFVQLVPDLADLPSEEDLAAFAAERLAAYKVPDRWTFVADLPTNHVGKIDRHALHQRAADLDAATEADRS